MCCLKLTWRVKTIYEIKRDPFKIHHWNSLINIMIHLGQWTLSSPGVIDIYTLCHVICDSGTVMHVIACLNGFATSILILSLLAHRRTFTNQVLVTTTNTCSQTRFPKPWKIVIFSHWKEKWDISFYYALSPFMCPIYPFNYNKDNYRLYRIISVIDKFTFVKSLILNTIWYEYVFINRDNPRLINLFYSEHLINQFNTL